MNAGSLRGQPLFKMHDEVWQRATLAVGTVLADPVCDRGEYWYKVRFGARTDNVVEENLSACIC